MSLNIYVNWQQLGDVLLMGNLFLTTHLWHKTKQTNKKKKKWMASRTRCISVMFPTERKRKPRKKSRVQSPSMVREFSGKFGVPWRNIIHLFFLKVYLTCKTTSFQQGEDLYDISQWTLDSRDKREQFWTLSICQRHERPRKMCFIHCPVV